MHKAISSDLYWMQTVKFTLGNVCGDRLYCPHPMPGEMILHSHSTYAMMLMLIKMGYELEFFKVVQSCAYFILYQIYNQI